VARHLVGMGGWVIGYEWMIREERVVYGTGKRTRNTTCVAERERERQPIDVHTCVLPLTLTLAL
jgi:hypothetical protein